MSSSFSPHDEEEILGKAYDSRLIGRLLAYVRPYTGEVFVALAMLMILSGLELAGPAIVKLAIDDAITRHDLGRLGGYAVVYLALAVLIFGLRYGQTYLLNRAGQTAMHDLRVQLFRHLQDLSMSFFDHNSVGRLMTRLTNDVDALNQLLTSGGLAILSDGLTVVGISIALLLLNWQLALLSFLLIPPVLLITNRLRDGMRSSYRQVRVRLSRVNGLIAEFINGMSVIQVFNREEAAFRRFDAANQDLLRANVRGVLYFALFWPVVGIASAITLAMVVWNGGDQVLRGALTVGGVVAYVQYLDRFFQPIRDLSEKYNLLQQAMAASERIFRILDERPAITDPPRPRKLGRIQGHVEFRDVWFAYEPGNWVLKGVSFRVEPGEKVAIVGATGAGKTSIIALLSRFYDVQRGQVLVDGVDVRELRQSELRRQVGVVLQDPYLFSGTVAHNIRLNDTSITDEQVVAAARRVRADAFIRALPRGYETELLERGAGLSVGEKQLIAFARAVAFDPRLLLVLDEATANIDTETEWLIQQALTDLMRDRTSIAIAHRLSTIREVDRIIVLHKGAIVEEGQHEALLKNGGLYARLYEIQFRDQERAADPERGMQPSLKARPA